MYELRERFTQKKKVAARCFAENHNKVQYLHHLHWMRHAKNEMRQPSYASPSESTTERPKAKGERYRVYLLEGGGRK